MPAALILGGLDAVAPGQARVVALSGRYQGTVRVTGLRWVNPFTLRKRMSTRIPSHETTTLKVDDADGNPIEMAAVVVWLVSDAAKASYAVEDVRAFVTTQAEIAVRHIAGHRGDWRVRGRIPDHAPFLCRRDRSGDAAPPAGKVGGLDEAPRPRW